MGCFYPGRDGKEAPINKFVSVHSGGGKISAVFFGRMLSGVFFMELGFVAFYSKNNASKRVWENGRFPQMYIAITQGLVSWETIEQYN